MRKLRMLLLTALCLVTAAPAPAVAEPVTHVVDVTTLAGYTPGSSAPIRLFEGDRLILVNTDIPWEQPTHDLVHISPEPLFASAEIGIGETSEVFGVDSLQPGSYPFYCFIHPLLSGTLEVLPAPL